ncbi:MAG TPA: hypothetical protein VKG44_11475 [Candidatus Baltobacteraceae bacterium]|nr:hypothetical protein [Candidatus Baltobacteraceae bacterium]
MCVGLAGVVFGAGAWEPLSIPKAWTSRAKTAATTVTSFRPVTPAGVVQMWDLRPGWGKLMRRHIL